MLDKNDLKAIADIVNNALDKKVPPIVDKKLTNALGDFFENIILPYFERLEKRHDKHDNDFDSLFRKLEKVDDHLINHEKRIKKLETTLQP